MNERLHQYALLMRLHKAYRHSAAAVADAVGVVDCATGHPDTRVLVVFVLGVVLMRSAGCVINDYADRQYRSACAAQPASDPSPRGA